LGLGALLLAACSGGGGGGKTTAPANAMTLSTTDPAGVTTTFTADNTNSIITTHKSEIENKTIVQICSDVDRDNDCSVMIIMTLDGTTAQTYSMDSAESLNQIVYHDDETETGVLSHYISTGGQIVVSEVGSSKDDPVKGTFTAALACISGCSGNIALSGTFGFALSE
jgi:hypothetical protein